MADFKQLIDTITKAVDKFQSQMPKLQQGMLDETLLLTKKLDTRGTTLRVSGSNIKLLTTINNQLKNVILTDEYKKATRELLSTFDKIVSLQNEYFYEVEKNFSPPSVQKEITKQAIASVANQLTENGLSANVTDRVYEMMRKSVTGGGDYNKLNTELKNYLTNTDTGDGILKKYTGQIAVDALNDFSGAYTTIITNDLGFEWYRYSGANIETTRPFCLACKEREWFHISEIPKVLKGDFPEFDDNDGTLDPKTGLPRGMKPNTDVTNFIQNRGGYNCGHQWRPGSATLVPKAIKDRVYATPEYQVWARANGKKAA